MSPSEIVADPDAIRQFAKAVRGAAVEVRNQGKKLEAAAGNVASRFRGREGAKAQEQAKSKARALRQTADGLDQEAAALDAFAKRVEAMRL